MTRPVDKAPAAFRTITEVSADIDVAPHVLRFWEGKFPQLRPMTRPGGRRFYRLEDVSLLKGLKGLLQEDGYTIKGVQKILKDQGVGFVRERGNGPVVLPEGQPTTLTHADNGPLPDRLADALAANPTMNIKLQQTLLRLEAARSRVQSVLAR